MNNDLFSLLWFGRAVDLGQKPFSILTYNDVCGLLVNFTEFHERMLISSASIRI